MDKVIATRNEYRLQSWAMVIKDCGDSGLTNKEYCRQHGINEKTYYYWLHKLRSQACEKTVPQLVAIAPGDPEEALRIEFKGA